MNTCIGKHSGTDVDNILANVQPLVSYTIIPNESDLNNYISIGSYGTESRDGTASLDNKPNGIIGSFVMYVLPLNAVWKSNVIQIIFEGYTNNIYFRKNYTLNGQQVWTNWVASDFKIANIKRKGTTVQRPIIADDVKDAHIGFCYIDESLSNKPIFYTGDTSNGKSGWIDATGANV